MKRKILVSDYDKTLYLNTFDFERNKKIIAKFREMGHLFVIATGRSYDDFLKKQNKNPIDYDYLLINHGATILDSKDHVLYNCPIGNLDRRSLINDLQLEKSRFCFCSSMLLSRVAINHPNLTKISILYKRFSPINRIKKRLTDYKNITVYRVSKNRLEIISSKINKYLGVKKLLMIENLRDCLVYTIGDGDTDLLMIKNFLGARMKHSSKSVKASTNNAYASVSSFLEKVFQEDLKKE